MYMHINLYKNESFLAAAVLDPHQACWTRGLLVAAIDTMQWLQLVSTLPSLQILTLACAGFFFPGGIF